MTKSPLLVFLLTFFYFTIIAQDKPPIKFGRVLPEDFITDNLKVDTADGAVIIADIGSSSFEGNNKGWFSLIYKHQRRIKIVNKKGFDLATVEIPLYISSGSTNEERLESLKASTYNLENGNVVEIKLDKSSIFKDKLTKNHRVSKFTMPAVKEGSIIEYSYTINSDFLFNLQPWNFQGDYPRVWSEYNLDLPSFFDYVFLAQGYNAFDIRTSEKRSASYIVRSTDRLNNISSSNTQTRWVIKNVPALKEEKFTSYLGNYISRIEFQMSGQQFPNSPYIDIMGDWGKVSEALLKDENFGERLYKDNNWLNDDLKPITEGAVNQLVEAKKIYAFIRDNIKCKGSGSIYLSTSLKETLKAKSGYEADVNLLLTAMLQHQHIKAEPVILSTRGNGNANEFYPLLNRFNYVICRVEIDGLRYFLDASKPYLGFGKIPGYCLNGPARVIDQYAGLVYLNADSAIEKKHTSVILFSDDEKAGKWTGSVNRFLGYYESSDVRLEFIDNGKEAFKKKLKESYGGVYSINDIRFEDENNNEVPMRITHSLAVDGDENASIIYFNPMTREGYKENFFTSAQRMYPVEMPYQMDENYNFQMEIPKGYVIDEMPKSAKVDFNDGEGLFEYLISKSERDITLRTRIKLNKATFMPEDYETLRSFFAFIVKKHAEQIVFKKK